MIYMHIYSNNYQTLALEWPDPEEGVRREKAAKKAKTKGLVDDFVVADDSDDEGASMRQKPKGKGKKNSRKFIFEVDDGLPTTLMHANSWTSF